MQTHATMYCKYYQLQVLYTLFSPILGQVYNAKAVTDVNLPTSIYIVFVGVLKSVAMHTCCLCWFSVNLDYWALRHPHCRCYWFIVLYLWSTSKGIFMANTTVCLPHHVVNATVCLPHHGINVKQWYNFQTAWYNMYYTILVVNIKGNLCGLFG